MEAIDKAIQSVYYKDRSLVTTRGLRVLLVITGLATGGATNVVLDIARYFKDRPDFDLHLVTGPIPPGRTDVTHLAYEMGISTQVVPSLVNRIDPITNWKAVLDLRRIMIEGKYDVVHTHSSVAGIVGRFAALAAGIPVIVHHVHGWALHDGMSRWTRMLYLTLERLCAKFTDRIIAVSDADIRKGLSQRIAQVDKFSLVYNGIDLEKFRHDVSDKQIRSELGLDPSCKLVGMIGRLDEQKNPVDLIRAAAIVVKRYPKVQFVIVGDGPLRPACEQLISELNLKDKFFLLGFRNDVAKILPILTIVAMSSLWEGLPLAFLEAMSAGKPIVANDIDGARDVVRNGETGFLVPPHQPQTMAEFILTLLNNASLRKKMGRVAQGYSDNYSLQKMVENIESLYKELGSVGQRSLAPLRKFLGWTAGRSFAAASVSADGTNSSLLGRSMRFQAPFSERRLLLELGDAMSVVAAQILALWLWSKSINWGISAESSQHYTWYSFIPALAVWLSLAWFNDLYHVPSSYVKSRTLHRIIQTTLLSMLIYGGIAYAIPGGLPLYYYVALTILLIPAVGSWRLFYTVVFKRNAFRQRILLIGNGFQSKETVRDIQKQNWSSYQTYKVVGYVHETKPKNKSDELLYLGQPRDLLSVIQRYRIHEIVVTADGRLKNEIFDALVECQSKGVRVSWMAEFYERLYQRVPVEHMNRRWALYMMQNRPVFNRTELAIKRLSDLVMLLMALPILLLVLLPIALAIKLESPGPAFYRQKRCGRGGEIFTIYKFRTMYVDAEKDGKARWASKGDPRISRVGRFLRKARLDEVPQLLNVLRGEMSIVGPRPERPELVEQLEKVIPFYRMRHLVKPGITGWAQINYDYGQSVHDALVKLQYDFYYVRYWSIWLDLYTLFRTVGVVLLLKGI
ncbi:MAG TPA: exopolysaccharide biosynthesis polyprenyl glycosylphosphotransferase [Anaerolineales bacterium]|nr:exopolysaccharide biosynthesis polyprenyl glycosylphosphotransferase [Anaerolineales bacterium]